MDLMNRFLHGTGGAEAIWPSHNEGSIVAPLRDYSLSAHNVSTLDNSAEDPDPTCLIPVGFLDLAFNSRVKVLSWYVHGKSLWHVASGCLSFRDPSACNRLDTKSRSRMRDRFTILPHQIAKELFPCYLFRYPIGLPNLYLS